MLCVFMEIVKLLNLLLLGEIKASNTYLLHYKILQHQGWQQLAQKEKENYVDELGHAEKLIDRIFFLSGKAEISCAKLETGHDITSIFNVNLKLESEAITNLKEAIDHSLATRDYGTLSLLQEMLNSEEEHFDWIRTQQSCIKSLGVENYLQRYG